MRTYAAFIYAFLYFPIAIIVFYSFNEGRYAMDWQGFSLQWYATAWNNPFVMEALKNSMITAGATSVLSVIIGTAAALGIERVRNTVLRQVFDALIYIAIIVPSIVIGIATLIAAVTVFNLVNPFLAALSSEESPLRLTLGLWTVIASHVLFNLAVVVLVVRARLATLDKNLVEAAQDLYATPSGVFRQVLLPLLLPSIVAGGLLAFTFSLEDYIITSFVAGPYSTLPIYVFASIRRGVTPEINAIGTVILFASFSLLIISQWLMRLSARKPVDRT
ncbi:MAG TPA: ABC transporter permease [Aestuariivirgaceae bacterium]|jgi:spermidine/putrescine transport system permease protein